MNIQVDLQMGAKSSILVERPKESQLSNMRQALDPMLLKRQEIEMYSVCCIIIKQNYKETWKINFQHNCQQLRSEYRWISVLKKACQEAADLERYEFYKQVHELRNRFIQKSLRSAKLMLPPDKIDHNEIKDLVKKSVVFLTDIVELSRPRHRTSMRSSHQRQIEHVRISKIPNSLCGPRISTGTVLDESIKNLFSIKKPKDLMLTNSDVQSAESLQLFVNFHEIVERHCEDNANILCVIKDTFIEYVHLLFGKIKGCTEKEVFAVTTDVMQFARLFKETIYDYYKLELMEDIYPVHNLFSDSNTLNAVTSIIFKDSTLYRSIYHVYEGLEGMKESALQKAMASCRSCQPEHFGVKRQYCLNQSSLTHALEGKELKNSGAPYSKCIRKLRQLEDVRTPVGKLKVIVSCADKITFCINDFYKGNGLDSKHSLVDADQILSIFTYILCMSRVRNIGVHLRIIENFSTSEQLLSITGYYFSVLLCASQNLLKESERFLGDDTRRSLSSTDRTQHMENM